MDFSFIVPLYNCLPLTKAMLDSLRKTTPSGANYEVILVDDGSTDGTREWLTTLGGETLVVLNDKNVGFAASCNRGASNARGRLLFFLNNDLVLQPHWLEPMVAAFTRFPNVGLVGNVQINAATAELDHTGIFFNHKGKPQHDTVRRLRAQLSGYQKVVALTGACFAISCENWRQLGGFDEGFINGAEDVDLCLRAGQAGMKNYVAMQSVVRHHVSASIGRKLRDEQNTYRLVQRWHETIVQLSVLDWCRNLLLTHSDQSFVYDYALVWAALGHSLGILPRPPRQAVNGARSAIELELDRWRTILPRNS